MWIVANGAPKTGSTWLIQLLKATGRFERVPEEFQNPNWENWSVRDGVEQASLHNLGASPNWYLSKQHWFEKNGNLVGVPGIKIINSIRDIRDTIVSRYYHDARVHGLDCSIEIYLRDKAKSLVRRACKYQKYWLDAAENQPGVFHVVTYERLSNDYENSIRDLLRFCEIDATEEEFDKVVERGSFKNLDSGPGKFLRKGRVHAFSDDLSESESEHLMMLAVSYGLPDIKRRMAAFNPSLKPFLEMTDTGL